MKGATKNYCDLLSQWSKSINLVQKESLHNVMERHVQDCQQLCSIINKDEKIIDVGSGAGLPGVILAINGFHNLTLCEKNIKKATFLRVVKIKLDLNYEILNEDVYNFKGRGEHTIISRAFGSVSTLCDLMLKINSQKGVFHKGETYMQEIKEASKYYYFGYEIIESITNPKGAIIKINNVRRKK
ncbi:MAG: 16S rRNA (guanine(527)-N(7))-methyltransferase RsmG [Holosporales bacterium]|jgi:16S rRNA (guanine527-N7)-methyltransferase|nr:16S rRNA (guanine(527)-N(7))-methyltransferase RsmG [Holosporales bacterium]